MKFSYCGMIGLLVIFILLTGCSGPSTTLSGTSNVKPSSAGKITASLTPTLKTTDAGSITIFDKSKFTWYEFVEDKTGDHYKFESTTGTFHGQPALLMRYTQTYGPQHADGQNIQETYTDSAGSVLGGTMKSILGGRVAMDVETNASMDPEIYDVKIPQNRVISSSTETVTVNAGTFVCDVYNIRGSEVKYFISPKVPVPIKMEYKYGYSWDLWAWG